MQARNIQINGYANRINATKPQIQTYLNAPEMKTKRLRYLRSGVFEIERISTAKFWKSYEIQQNKEI